MKRVIIAAIVAVIALSCTPVQSNKYIVTSDGDTIQGSYLIGERKVGNLDRGATVSRLYKLYGEKYVKQLKAPSQEVKRDSSGMATYYIYNPDNQLLFVAMTDGDSSSNPEIKSLIIKDKEYSTAQGITLKSTIGEFCEAYPEAVVVQDQSRYFLFEPSLDLYARVDESNILDHNSEFVVDIPIGNLRSEGGFESLSVSWDINNTNILTPQFWHDLLARILRWTIFELPIIIFIVLIFIVLRKLVSFSISKINAVVRRRVESDKTLDASEAVKRVDTITGILHGVLSIILWSIFVLTLLSKFNINIAPILASAGILGLAVGFGAQELVRDFICGFFILLEDQIRTGDMAIINDTMGVVEKIELRTVTLRDSSGVVHIFQNGKINTLSNMTKEWSAIVLEIGVAYKEDVDRVIAIMKEVGTELRSSKVGHLMLDDIEVWGLDAFADSALMIKMVIKTRPMQQWRIKREYQRLLKIRFDAEGIEIPFPHLSLYTGEATKPMPLNVMESQLKEEEGDSHIVADHGEVDK